MATYVIQLIGQDSMFFAMLPLSFFVFLDFLFCLLQYSQSSSRLRTSFSFLFLLSSFGHDILRTVPFAVWRLPAAGYSSDSARLD